MGAPYSLVMHEILTRLGLDRDPRVVPASQGGDGCVISVNPATGEGIAGVKLDTADSYEKTVARSVEAFKRWRTIPAPKRGEVIRQIGNAYRDCLEDLGSLVSLEMGKIKAEGIGEVQETIDIADFAVGQSRQLTGITI